MSNFETSLHMATAVSGLFVTSNLSATKTEQTHEFGVIFCKAMAKQQKSKWKLLVRPQFKAWDPLAYWTIDPSTSNAALLALCTVPLRCQ